MNRDLRDLPGARDIGDAGPAQARSSLGLALQGALASGGDVEFGIAAHAGYPVAVGVAIGAGHIVVWSSRALAALMNLTTIETMSSCAIFGFLVKISVMKS